MDNQLTRETVTVTLSVSRVYNPEYDGSTREADLRADLEFVLEGWQYDVDDITIDIEHTNEQE